MGNCALEEARGLAKECDREEGLRGKCGERMGFGLAKSAAVLAVSMSDRRNLENQAEGYGGVASARTHIRSRSPR